jgi:hypothetical protein
LKTKLGMKEFDPIEQRNTVAFIGFESIHIGKYPSALSIGKKQKLSKKMEPFYLVSPLSPDMGEK